MLLDADNHDQRNWSLSHGISPSRENVFYAHRQLFHDSDSAHVRPAARDYCSDDRTCLYVQIRILKDWLRLSRRKAASDLLPEKQLRPK